MMMKLFQHRDMIDEEFHDFDRFQITMLVDRNYLYEKQMLNRFHFEERSADLLMINHRDFQSIHLDYLDNLDQQKYSRIAQSPIEKDQPLKCHVARTLDSSLVPHRNNPSGISTVVTAKTETKIISNFISSYRYSLQLSPKVLRNNIEKNIDLMSQSLPWELLEHPVR